MDKQQKELNKTELEQRGWTSRMIAEYLGAGAESYPADRVFALENELPYFVSRRNRDEQLRAFIGKTQKKTNSRLQSVEVTLECIEREELEDAAIRHFVKITGKRPKTNPGSIRRICVNYIRHCLTNYDAVIREHVNYRPGQHESVNLWRRRVYAKIAQVYPELAKECQNQLRSKGV